jgi:hypothetical protein
MYFIWTKVSGRRGNGRNDERRLGFRRKGLRNSKEREKHNKKCKVRFMVLGIRSIL